LESQTTGIDRPAEASSKKRKGGEIKEAAPSDEQLQLPAETYTKKRIRNEAGEAIPTSHQEQSEVEDHTANEGVKRANS
jgi:hypothetical protein